MQNNAYDLKVGKILALLDTFQDFTYICRSDIASNMVGTDDYVFKNREWAEQFQLPQK